MASQPGALVGLRVAQALTDAAEPMEYVLYPATRPHASRL